MDCTDRLVPRGDNKRNPSRGTSRLKFAELDHVIWYSTSSHVRRSGEFLGETTVRMKSQPLTFTEKLNRMADMMGIFGIEPAEITTSWIKPQNFGTKERGEGSALHVAVHQPRDKSEGKCLYTPVPQPRVLDKQTSTAKPQDLGTKDRDERKYRYTPVPQPRVLDKQTSTAKPQDFGTKHRDERKYRYTPVPRPRDLQKLASGTKPQGLGIKDGDDHKNLYTPVPQPRVHEKQISMTKPRNVGIKEKGQGIYLHTPVPLTRVLEKQSFGISHDATAQQSSNHAPSISRKILSSKSEKGLEVNGSANSLSPENLTSATPMSADVTNGVMAWELLNGCEPPKSAKYCQPIICKALNSRVQEVTTFNNDLEEESVRVIIPAPSYPDPSLRVASWLLASDFTGNSNLSSDEFDPSCDVIDSSRKCRVFLPDTTSDVKYRHTAQDTYREREVFTADQLPGVLSPRRDPSLCGECEEPGDLESWREVRYPEKLKDSKKRCRTLLAVVEGVRVLGKRVARGLIGRCVKAKN